MELLLGHGPKNHTENQRGHWIAESSKEEAQYSDDFADPDVKRLTVQHVSADKRKQGDSSV